MGKGELHGAACKTFKYAAARLWGEMSRCYCATPVPGDKVHWVRQSSSEFISQSCTFNDAQVIRGLTVTYIYALDKSMSTKGAWKWNKFAGEGHPSICRIWPDTDGVASTAVIYITRDVMKKEIQLQMTKESSLWLRPLVTKHKLIEKSTR